VALTGRDRCFRSARFFGNTYFVNRSMETPSRKRGRPASGRDPHITARLPEDMIRDLDRLAHERRATRSEVLRDLLRPALDAVQRDGQSKTK
jgi:Ribbon-helix-helix protein, copG family